MSMADEERDKVAGILKGLREKNDQLEARNTELAGELAEIKKLLNPDEDEPSEDPLKKVVDYIDSEREAKEARKRKREERYHLSTTDDDMKAADELWRQMLKDAETELEEE